MPQQLPTRIDLMDDIRGTYGLEEADTSLDTHIYALPSLSKFRLLCQWNLGDRDWAEVLIAWMRQCGMEVKE